jgi:outer membrane protein OmpA-like peptidoglycan-associated protein
MAGLTGPAGATGRTGPQGTIGPIGQQGASGAGENWSSYRDYRFNVNSDDILSSDSNKAREVADYLQQNPSARVAIDGSSERRVSRVRTALMDAGVPAYKIQTGAFGDAQQRRDGQVMVLVSNK